MLLFDEKSQCSFGKKNIALKASQYYIKDGPRKTTVDFQKNITEKTELKKEKLKTEKK